MRLHLRVVVWIRGSPLRHFRHSRSEKLYALFAHYLPVASKKVIATYRVGTGLRLMGSVRLNGCSGWR